jgi:enoyl-CoA hydratase/carnithine racemase
MAAIASLEAVVLDLTETLWHLTRFPRPLTITGNDRFFSAGADLNEIAALTGPDAQEFSKWANNSCG